MYVFGGVETRYYSIDADFIPRIEQLASDEWIYIVNFYGQLDNHIIATLRKKYEKIIVDNVQAYFQLPVQGVDTIYSCRKFFGVPDGAFLYTDQCLEEKLVLDKSDGKMRYLLGRFEHTASEFYEEYKQREKQFENEPIKQMSKLTYNLLHGIDYEFVQSKRNTNFMILYDALCTINKLSLLVPNGAFMYPLYIENGAKIRNDLRKKKIYIPTLWPDVFDICCENEMEYNMAQNILPLPIDQRYGAREMHRICEILYHLL